MKSSDLVFEFKSEKHRNAYERLLTKYGAKPNSRVTPILYLLAWIEAQGVPVAEHVSTGKIDFAKLILPGSVSDSIAAVAAVAQHLYTGFRTGILVMPPDDLLQAVGPDNIEVVLSAARAANRLQQSR